MAVKKNVDTISAPKKRAPAKRKAVADTALAKTKKKAPLQKRTPRKKIISVPEIIPEAIAAPVPVCIPPPALDFSQVTTTPPVAASVPKSETNFSILIKQEYVRMGVLAVILLCSVAFYLHMNHNYKVNFVDTAEDASSL